MRLVIPLVIVLAVPAPAFAQHGTPPLLIPVTPAPPPPPPVAPSPVPSVVTPLPTPSYDVPPCITGAAPLGSGGTVRSVYRGIDPPVRKKFRRKRPLQSSTK